MKGGIAKRAAIVALSFLGSLFAVEKEFSISIIAPDRSIHPEEPLSLQMTLEMASFEGRPVKAVFVNNDDIHMRVQRPDGTIVAESKRWSWRCSEVPRYTWLARLDKSPDRKADKWLVFNEWCSTSLPPGEYKVECDIAELGIVFVGENTSVRKKFDPAVRTTFSFRILEPNKEAVRKLYEQLLAKYTSTQLG